MGVATSSATFFRSIGGTVGTAVFLSILFSTVGDKIGNGLRRRCDRSGRSRPRCEAGEPAVRPAQGRLQGGEAGVDLNNTEFLEQARPGAGQADPRRLLRPRSTRCSWSAGS